MIPLLQTKFGEGVGNCLQACVASLLEMSLDAVPNFCEGIRTEDGQWWHDLRTWAAEFDYAVVGFDTRVQGFKNLVSMSHGHLMHIRCGRLDGVGHAVVYQGETVLHNPSPMHRDEELDRDEFAILFIPFDPAHL